LQRKRKKSKQSSIDEALLYSIVSEIVLSLLAEEVDDSICVPVETYRNVVERVRRICPRAVERLEENWKTFIVEQSVKGFRIKELEYDDYTPWNELIVKCKRLNSQHTVNRPAEPNHLNIKVQEIERLLSLIPSASTAEKFTTILKALFALRLDGDSFKQALKNVLITLLPQDCRVETEYYFATGSRQDVYVDCTNVAVVFEVKTPEEGTAVTASHNPLRQAEQYAKLLAKHHRDKPIAVIIVRTDGKTPKDLVAGGFREALSEEAREAIHVLSEENLEPTLKTAKHIAKKDKAKLTLEKLLELVAEGRIDTIKLTVRNTGR
jgi:hypothetical protein